MNTLTRPGPTIRRHKSEQEVATPWLFIEKCQARFGPIHIDLAATAQNTKAPEFITPEQDSLAPWTLWHADKNGNHIPHRLGWLNPEFSNIAPWAEKCASESRNGMRILLLTPASIGANWFKKWVEPNAVVIGLNGRIQFIGSNDPYPKDLMLSVFWAGLTGFQTWRWNE